MSADSSDSPDSPLPALPDTTDDHHLREEPIASERVFEGVFLRVERDRVRLPDGKTALREYIRHPGAVMIIALFDDGRVVLERQFRYPLHRSFIEFPAGKIDPDEPPLQCAIRELREETGYTAARWQHVCTLHNAIAYADEHIEIYLATGLTAGERRLDEGEFLDVLTLPAEELLEAVRRGEITDVKTMLGAFWLDKIRSGAWTA